MVLAQNVGRKAAGNNHRVKIIRGDLGNRSVGHHRIALLAQIRLARFLSHSDGLGPILTEAQQGVPNFQFLVLVSHQYRNPLSMKVHDCLHVFGAQTMLPQ